MMYVRIAFGLISSERAAGDAEDVERLGSLGAVARVGAHKRSRRVELARKPFDPLVFAHLRVISEPERRVISERAAVCTLAMLPQIERRQMRTEDRNLPH